MSSIRYIFIGIICLSLVTQSESWWFLKPIIKPLCKITFGIVCPVGLAAGAAAVAVGSGGLAAGASAGGAALGALGCSVAKDNCKRNLDGEMVMLPFSDNFDDYDKNGDDFMTFTEFLEAVTSTVKLSDPEDLIPPFRASDTDGDKKLNRNEFAHSEFLFPEENEKRILASINRRK